MSDDRNLCQVVFNSKECVYALTNERKLPGMNDVFVPRVNDYIWLNWHRSDNRDDKVLGKVSAVILEEVNLSL